MRSPVLLSAAVVALALLSLACSSDQKAIKPASTSGKIDKSTAHWEEPGATPDKPLDAGSAMDGSVDAGVDAGAPADSGAPDGSADAASTPSDAGADAASADAG